VKGILKRPPGGKKGGILKKSCSTGNMKDIRDSLEITRVHLQTSADDKDQRVNITTNKNNIKCGLSLLNFVLPCVFIGLEEVKVKGLYLLFYSIVHVLRILSFSPLEVFYVC